MKLELILTHLKRFGFWTTPQKGHFSLYLTLEGSWSYVWIGGFENEHFGQPLQLQFQGKLDLNNRFSTLLAQFGQVLLAILAIFSQNRPKSPFEGTCPGRPKSRFEALWKYVLLASSGAKILCADYFVGKTMACVFWAPFNILSPKLRGAEIAILLNFTFWANFGDFTKTPFGAVPGL